MSTTSGQDGQPRDDAEPTDEPVAVVSAAISCMGALDIDAVVALMADDFVLELPFRNDGGPRTMRRADAEGFMRAMPKLFSRMDFHDVVIHGATPTGVVVAEYRSDGLTHGGRPYPNSYVALFEIRDGRLASWREFFDPMVVATTFAS